MIQVYKIAINILLCLLLTAVAAPVLAQGHENNPLVLKLRNYEQVHIERGFKDLEFPMSDVELLTISGDRTYASFRFNSAGGTKRHPASAQIMEAYYQKIRSLRGRVVYKGAHYATFRVKSNEKEFWCVIESYMNGEGYALSIVEKESIQKVDEAREMLAELNEKGLLDVYISFNSGSAELSKTSYPVIKEITKLLRYAPEMHISIEGHTDNVGSPQRNKELSLMRANAVKKALVMKGIAPNRLTTKGWGQEKPIATNDTEKGRLKNRRVSIVKLNM